MINWQRYCVPTPDGTREIMVGRKRKRGNRESNGRIQREAAADPRLVAASMPHRRGIKPIIHKDGRVEHRQHDPKAENPIGRLLLNGWITQAQYDAGVWWRGIVHRYRAIIEAPKPDPLSMSGVIVGPWGRGQRDLSDDEAQARKQEYMDGFADLERDAGHAGAKAVSHFVIHERIGLPLTHLRCGLDALITRRALTFSRKSVSQK